MREEHARVVKSAVKARAGFLDSFCIISSPCQHLSRLGRLLRRLQWIFCSIDVSATHGIVGAQPLGN
jgi:hypothetical protein